MSETLFLGIDAGGTHTDAVLMAAEHGHARLISEAKVPTLHDDLPKSIADVLLALKHKLSDQNLLHAVQHVTLGTTLAVNALVQKKNDPVGLLLTAGSGLSPTRFAMDEHFAILPGGLDHRGVEVTSLDVTDLPTILQNFRQKNIHALACVGKFSPREPKHECTIGKICEEAGFKITLGHTLSGQLNFPRRIATAWYNASVARIQNTFLDAVEATLKDMGIQAHIRLLKADGGAIPISLARNEPVQSILSGPAASVMGILALSHEIEQGTSLLLDIGGTTTDIALIVDGSPVIDRDGMLLEGRRTLVRALASISIGVGGDSVIAVQGEGDTAQVTTGPNRLGAAMAFGGSVPTFLDALNTLDEHSTIPRGDVARSKAGILSLAEEHRLDPKILAQKAVQNGLTHIHTACNRLIEQINARPIYTLAELRARTKAYPDKVLLVGGPAQCLKAYLEKELGLPIIIPTEAAVANAVGACLTRPTDSLEVYVDTGRQELRAPRLDHRESVNRSVRENDVKKRACELLTEHLHSQNVEDCAVEVIEADLFATLDDYGSGSKDIRVTAQAVPGILARPV